jgi:uncharacterized membrane protein YjjB (DUF3815 family)
MRVGDAARVAWYRFRCTWGAEIVDYRSMGTAPALLAAALAVGAVSIVLGRLLWTPVACQISVVCLANLVAAVPGHIAGRTPAAASLRAE